ncbi:hypothetical protein KSP39_PZI014424 [Platanthera zijinensis]|uniref:Uncharacterized protein n=1 Tax=Platanthera zijinensis TaxID=2320716 RepID=A0AAP0BBB0_9ASPA
MNETISGQSFTYLNDLATRQQEIWQTIKTRQAESTTLQQSSEQTSKEVYLLRQELATWLKIYSPTHRGGSFSKNWAAVQHPNSTYSYGYENRQYQRNYYSHTQQTNYSSFQQKSASEHAGASYQPHSSNTSFYATPTSCVNQTSVGCPISGYVNQTDCWNGGSYSLPSSNNVPTTSFYEVVNPCYYGTGTSNSYGAVISQSSYGSAAPSSSTMMNDLSEKIETFEQKFRHILDVFEHRMTNNFQRFMDIISEQKRISLPINIEEHIPSFVKDLEQITETPLQVEDDFVLPRSLAKIKSNSNVVLGSLAPVVLASSENTILPPSEELMQHHPNSHGILGSLAHVTQVGRPQDDKFIRVHVSTWRIQVFDPGGCTVSKHSSYVEPQINKFQDADLVLISITRVIWVFDPGGIKRRGRRLNGKGRNVTVGIHVIA